MSAFRSSSFFFSILVAIHFNFQSISMFSAKSFLYVILSINAVVWYAFQKKLFPKWLTKILSSFYFWPTFPVTALLRTGNYWTPIDETVCPVCFLRVVLLLTTSLFAISKCIRLFWGAHPCITWVIPKPCTTSTSVEQ